MDKQQAPLAILSDLVPGERMLWTGQPVQGVILSARLLRLNIVGAAVLLVSLTWNMLVMAQVGLFGGARGGAVLWALYLGGIALGLWLTIGVHIADAGVRVRTQYAVTDRAAYVLAPGQAQAVRHPIGSATSVSATGGRWPSIRLAEPGSPAKIVFRDLAEAPAVHEILLRMKEGRA